ncbi:hypothetical protein [Sphaerisporangium flaviroseum]|uniref:hypothetical protein n=1 Tax=Sphaerisporangium flaviroseum TaxID=509199 RepID=UPI0031EDA0E6
MDAPPVDPAAVYVYDVASGSGRLLVGDFDISLASAHSPGDPAALVAADAAAFAADIRRCGGRVITDISPTGGRHVYVLWQADLPFDELRRVARALARRYRTFDPKPMCGLANGLIRPPGSVHRRGGRQRLTMSLDQARAAIDHPNGPGVWDRLLELLEQDLHAVEQGEREVDLGELVVDEAGAPWLPRPGSNASLPLRPEMERTARLGIYSHQDYASDSNARQAVLAAAAERGWRLADVTGRLREGVWPGMARFYSRYRPGRPVADRLEKDWKKAVTFVLREKTRHSSHTRELTHRGGHGAEAWGEAMTQPVQSKGGEVSEIFSLESYRYLRTWWSALRVAEVTGRWSGRGAITYRRVLRAIVAAAQMSVTSHGSPYPEFGTRNLGLMCGLDHSTVAKALKKLREESDPFLERLDEDYHPDTPEHDRVRPRHGTAGDRYRLLIPAAYADVAAWRRWKPGKLGAVHPVFRGELGGPAALVYEHLGADDTKGLELAHLAGLSPTATNHALRQLAEYGLAERGRHGWHRGPIDPDVVADALGVDQQIQQLRARHRAERLAWRAYLTAIAVPDTLADLLAVPQDPDLATADPHPLAASDDPTWPATGQGPEPPPWLPPEDAYTQQTPAAALQEEQLRCALQLIQDELGGRPISPSARPGPPPRDLSSNTRAQYRDLAAVYDRRNRS